MQRRTFLSALAALPAAGLAAPPALRPSQLTASTACLAGLTFPQALRKIRELGLGGVEILAFTGQSHSVGPIPGAVVNSLSPAEKKQLRREVGRFERVSTHLPFHGLRPAARDAALRRKTLDLLHQAIDDSGFWGATIGTLHIAPEPGFTYEQIWSDLVAVFRELGDHAARYKLRLGIETGSPNTVREYLAILRDIDHDFVGATVDTGHTRSYRRDIGVDDDARATGLGARRYNDILMAKVEALGPKLFHFHVDDVRPEDWRDHRTLGTGLVDWTRLLTHLSKTGYRGDFALELEESPVVEALQQSQSFFRKTLAKAASFA